MTTPKYVDGKRLKQPKYVAHSYEDPDWGKLIRVDHLCPVCDSLLENVDNGYAPMTFRCKNGHGEFDRYGE